MELTWKVILKPGSTPFTEKRRELLLPEMKMEHTMSVQLYSSALPTWAVPCLQMQTVIRLVMQVPSELYRSRRGQTSLYKSDCKIHGKSVSYTHLRAHETDS